MTLHCCCSSSLGGGQAVRSLLCDTYFCDLGSSNPSLLESLPLNSASAVYAKSAGLQMAVTNKELTVVQRTCPAPEACVRWSCEAHMAAAGADLRQTLSRASREVILPGAVVGTYPV